MLELQKESKYASMDIISVVVFMITILLRCAIRDLV